MWDDEIDKNIRDAADQYHPAYDENAWDKMKVMLDEHMPVEKKKRRFLFIPLFALLVAGSYFVYHYSKNNDAVDNKETTTANKNVNSKTNLPETSTAQLKDNSSKDNITAIQAVPQKSSSTADVSTIKNSSSSPVSVPRVTTLPSTSTGKASTDNISTSKVSVSHQQHLIDKPVDNTGNKKLTTTGDKIRKYKTGKTKLSTTSGTVDNGNTATTEVDNKVDNSSIKDEQQNKTEKDISTETPANTEAKPKVKKEIVPAKKDTVAKAAEVKKTPGNKKLSISKGFNNNFAITISAGPDVSSVNFNHAGKVAINYGAGVSYALSARFTLHTGFYISDKIYSADKYQYHTPTGMTTNSYLYNIAANCKVYEIPVTVSYSFSKSKNHQWFAAGGLSSYLMKKETYDYYYKYPSGNTDTKTWSISNKNQSYFSVLDLSGGYEYFFNKRVSLLTEPYLKIPLAGVGAGKVKLNSGGILFTLTVKPFK